MTPVNDPLTILFVYGTSLLGPAYVWHVMYYSHVIINYFKLQLTNSTLVHWGFCLPAVCSNRDAEILISITTGHKNVTIPTDRCQTNAAAKLTPIDAFYGYSERTIPFPQKSKFHYFRFRCVILAMVLMVLFCTCYHFSMYYTNANYKEVRPRGCLEQAILAFSVIGNYYETTFRHYVILMERLETLLLIMKKELEMFSGAL